MEFDRLRTLFWLYEQFKKGQRFSRRAIEQQFTLSPRTVRRYIDILRTVYKLPIIYDDKKNCYYCVRTSDQFTEI